jgi:hypothetical protein
VRKPPTSLGLAVVGRFAAPQQLRHTGRLAGALVRMCESVGFDSNNSFFQ